MFIGYKLVFLIKYLVNIENKKNEKSQYINKKEVKLQNI